MHHWVSIKKQYLYRYLGVLPALPIRVNPIFPIHQAIFLCFRLRTRPACSYKGDLVDEICDVVGHVEVSFIHCSEQVTEQIAKRVDAPADCDNHAHVIEGLCDGLGGGFCRATGFTSKDFVKNEGPTGQATHESRPRWEGSDLAAVAKKEHDSGANQESPEHTRGGGLASCLEDQVELNHLQRYGDAPIHIPVDNRRFVNLHPVLTHVHVMHACHQSDQRTSVQGCLPVGTDGCRFKEKEKRGGNHCNGDDPKGDGNTVRWLQKCICRVGHRGRR